MPPSQQRPHGGRFAQWTNGEAILAADVLPPGSSASRVITAPLPTHAAAAPPARSEAEAGGGPSGNVSTGAAPASTRRAAEIKDHPAADRLLAALSSYDRPYLAEETAQTSGQAAAVYAAAPRALAPAMPTPPREPPTQLTRSVIEEIAEHRALAARGTEERRAITVVARGLVASPPDSPDEESFRAPTKRAAPRWLWPAAGFVVLVLGALAIVRGVRNHATVASPEAATPPAGTASVLAAPPEPTAPSAPSAEPSTVLVEASQREPGRPPPSPSPSSPLGANLKSPRPLPSIAPAPPVLAPSSSTLVKPTFQVQN